MVQATQCGLIDHAVLNLEDVDLISDPSQTPQAFQWNGSKQVSGMGSDDFLPSQPGDQLTDRTHRRWVQMRFRLL